MVVACGGSSVKPDAPRPDTTVDSARYRAELAAITGPRSPGTPHWQAVQDLCAARFEELGFMVERHAYGTGVNVIGVRTGTSLPDQRVIVSAHYDSTNNCPGADDNGTGIAGVFEVARAMSTVPHARTLVVACWDEEERGLIGSRAFVEREVAAGSSYTASYVFEMIGYHSTEPDTQQTDPNLSAAYPEQTQAIADNQFRGDFILVIHDDLAADAVAGFETAAAGLSLPTIALPVAANVKKSNLAAGLRRSDHAPFWDVDVPAIQLTDTANFRNPHYHCDGGPDVLEDIDVDFATSVVRATVAAVDRSLGR
jgi:Zn-dependent M28 family amino/carboxypeptidase